MYAAARDGWGTERPRSLFCGPKRYGVQWGGSRVWLEYRFGQPRNDHQSAARARRAMPPPPDDDRAVDDASQALSELSTNVNDFLRMQAKVGIPSLVERLPRRARRRAVVVQTSATRARRARVERRARP